MKKTLFILAAAFCLEATAQTLCMDTAKYYSVAGNAEGITKADFNGDGFQDIAVTNYSTVGSVAVLLGVGNGTFGTATSFTIGTYPKGIASADFNNDNKIDLVVTNSDSSNVSLMLGTGTGSFGTVTKFAVGSDPVSVICADFNGDNKTDIATANQNSNNVSILLGTGSGSFGAVTNFAVGAVPNCVACADFNGDGKKDLVTANYGNSGFGNTVSVLLGTGTGSFGAATSFGVSTGPSGVISADFDGDNKADLAVADLGVSKVSVLLGTGTGSFAAATSYATGPGGSGPRALTSADFNLDGKLDLAIANGSYYVAVLLGTGTGTFGTATTLRSTSAHTIISGDFNGDGKPDLATNKADILLNCSTITLGINKFLSNDKNFKIYPNPSSGNFVIETSNTEIQTIQLFDINGKNVFSQSINGKTNVDVSNLNAGIYNISLISNEGVVNKRVVIFR